MSDLIEQACICCDCKFIGEKPEYCCIGSDCGCQGLPKEPPLCEKCASIFYGETTDSEASQ